MIKDWNTQFRVAMTLALANEYGDGNPRYTLQGCSAEEAARIALESLANVLQQYRMDAVHSGYIVGAEAARERVREAYADGRTDPEDIIRVAGPQEGRKRDAVSRNRQARQEPST
jgi:hypothetical protein